MVNSVTFFYPHLKTRHCSAGFTLIELLVVLAIVASSLTLAVPRYLNQLETSKEAVLRDNLRTTRSHRQILPRHRPLP